jgi:hypothetical protein
MTNDRRSRGLGGPHVHVVGHGPERRIYVHRCRATIKKKRALRSVLHCVLRSSITVVSAEPRVRPVVRPHAFQAPAPGPELRRHAVLQRADRATCRSSGVPTSADTGSDPHHNTHHGKASRAKTHRLTSAAEVRRFADRGAQRENVMNVGPFSPVLLPAIVAVGVTFPLAPAA